MTEKGARYIGMLVVCVLVVALATYQSNGYCFEDHGYEDCVGPFTLDPERSALFGHLDDIFEWNSPWPLRVWWTSVFAGFYAAWRFRQKIQKLVEFFHRQV